MPPADSTLDLLTDDTPVATMPRPRTLSAPAWSAEASRQTLRGPSQCAQFIIDAEDRIQAQRVASSNTPRAWP